MKAHWCERSLNDLVDKVSSLTGRIKYKKINLLSPPYLLGMTAWLNSYFLMFHSLFIP